jgi:hypothetical protein
MKRTKTKAKASSAETALPVQPILEPVQPALEMEPASFYNQRWFWEIVVGAILTAAGFLVRHFSGC